MKRKQHTRSEIQTWLRRYRRANLPVRVFTRRYGLAESTFYKWLRECPESPEERRAPQVIEISGLSGEGHFCGELIWPDGRRLRFSSTLPPATLRGWLAAVEASR